MTHNILLEGVQKMPNQTTNFGFDLPIVNSPTDKDVWGALLNGNFTDLDDLLKVTTSSKSSNFAVGTGEFNYFYLINASGGAVTATLPAASTVFAGFKVHFKAVDVTNTITIDGSGSETIDGSTTLTMKGLNDGLSIVCDGTNWRILADFRKKPALIDSVSISSVTEMEFKKGINSDFDTIEFDIPRIESAATGVIFSLQVSTDGGATYKSGATDYNYGYTRQELNSSPAVVPLNGASSSLRVFDSYSVLSGIPASLKIRMSNHANTSYRTMFTWQGIYPLGTVPAIVQGGGTYNATTAVNAVKLFVSSTTVNLTGIGRAYGYEK